MRTPAEKRKRRNSEEALSQPLFKMSRIEVTKDGKVKTIKPEDLDAVDRTEIEKRYLEEKAERKKAMHNMRQRRYRDKKKAAPLDNTDFAQEEPEYQQRFFTPPQPIKIYNIINVNYTMPTPFLPGITGFNVNRLTPKLPPIMHHKEQKITPEILNIANTPSFFMQNTEHQKIEVLEPEFSAISYPYPNL